MKIFYKCLGSLALAGALALAGCGGGGDSSAKTSTDVTLPDGVDFLEFPSDFLWGSATSAYQVEGGYDEGGRGETNWDFFTHTLRLANGETGDVAIDQYHRYADDIALMAAAGLKTYRFSIAWSRIYPNGYPYEVDSDGDAVLDDDGNTIAVEPNAEGVAYYNAVIDELLANGIEPVITLFHWDMPLALWYSGGFANRDFLPLFDAYAEACFRQFGDRVSRWITVNEPFVWATFYEGMMSAIEASGATNSDDIHALMKTLTLQDVQGSQLTYIHHYLLAHAQAVAIHDELESEGVILAGDIGLSLDMGIAKAATNSTQDVAAAETYNKYKSDLYTYPLYKGKYPDGVLETYASLGYGINLSDDQLAEDLAYMKAHAGDFVGVNYYSRNYVSHLESSAATTEHTFSWDTSSWSGLFMDDIWVEDHPEDDASANGIYDPQGMYDTLAYVDDVSDHRPILITENGAGYTTTNDDSLTDSGEVHDTLRTRFLKGHVQATWLAIHDGINVIGYTAWSLFDNFEWSSGYGTRFGLIYIDYTDDLKRYPKDSYYWLQQTVTDNGTDAD